MQPNKPFEQTLTAFALLTARAFSLRCAQGERGAERLVPALRSATGEPGTRDGSPFGGPLSAALGSFSEARGFAGKPSAQGKGESPCQTGKGNMIKLYAAASAWDVPNVSP